MTKKRKKRKNQDMKVFVRAVGRIRNNELSILKEDIDFLELKNFVTVFNQEIEDDYCEVQIEIEKDFAALLENSLSEEGMLRRWNARIKMQK